MGFYLNCEEGRYETHAQLEFFVR